MKGKGVEGRADGGEEGGGVEAPWSTGLSICVHISLLQRQNGFLNSPSLFLLPSTFLHI